MKFVSFHHYDRAACCVANSSIRRILAFLIAGIISFTANSKNKSSNGEVQPEAFIETVLSPQKTVAGVSSLYTIAVYSTVPDILQIRIVSEPDFGKLKVSRLRTGGNANQYLGEYKKNGKIWYGYVADAFIVTPDTKGNYEIAGGEYSVCVGIEKITDDWFWGPRRTTVPYWIEAGAPDIKLNAGSRPSALGPDEAVSTGDFKAQWEIPPGDIIENSRAIAVYHIFGQGILDQHSIPEFEKLLGEDIEVAYIRPSVKTQLKGTDLYSDMEIVVEFFPRKSGKIKIPDVSFRFLDYQSGKIKTVPAPKVEIEVKSEKPSPSVKAKIYEI